jgi:hypothetical protein
LYTGVAIGYCDQRGYLLVERRNPWGIKYNARVLQSDLVGIVV